MTRKALIINGKDNVANLIGPGTKGDAVECRVEGESGTATISLQDDIPANHKFARNTIKAGEEIIKYGLPIGRASKDIAAGQYVHVHNIESNRGRGDLKK